MNKRIKSLADNAELTKGVWSVPDFILERFAKSIVRECANAVRAVPTCGPGSKGCDEIIREHFGIKK
jgi:hypothetical protein